MPSLSGLLDFDRPWLLCTSAPQLAKHWKHLAKREAKAAKEEGHVPVQQRPEAAFLPGEGAAVAAPCEPLAEPSCCGTLAPASLMVFHQGRFEVRRRAHPWGQLLLLYLRMRRP